MSTPLLAALLLAAPAADGLHPVEAARLVVGPPAPQVARVAVPGEPSDPARPGDGRATVDAAADGTLVVVDDAPVAQRVPERAPPRPARGLVEVVPTGTASLLHRRATPGSALADSYALEVVDAVLDARFDAFLLETLERFGANVDLVAFLASWRNMFQSVGGAVPWRELVQREFLIAQTSDASAEGDLGLPAILFACRPEPARLDDIESSLAGFMGSAAALLGTNGLYDIRTETAPTGVETTVHRLGLPALGGETVLQMAVHGPTILLGLGGPYFDDAVELARGVGDATRLSDTPRFRRAFDGLPEDSPEIEYLDVPRLVAAAEDRSQLFLDASWNSGTLQTALNESFALVDHLDTVAKTTRYAGTDVVTETLTRFDRATTAGNVMASVGVAGPADAELLGYVPADAVSFSLRGPVDLVPVWRHMQERVRTNFSWGEDALWSFGILEAAVDLSVERDLLSWLGAEHVTVTMPSRKKYPEPGETDTVFLCKVPDPEAAKKALGRALAIYEAAAPRVLGGVQGLLADVQDSVGIALDFDVSLGPAAGSFRSLNRVELALGTARLPFTFGVMGDLLVASTSEEALMSCMMVMAEEEDGVGERPILASLAGRGGLSTVELVPMGRQMRETVDGIHGLQGMLNGFLGPMAGEDETIGTIVDCGNELFARIHGVLGTVDFLDDAVVVSEGRDGGLARWERRLVRLVAPEARPSHAVAEADVR